jgi:hypothetical protein
MSDERRHDASAAPDWNEWWDLTYAQADGPAGFVRLALYPNQRVAWYWAYVLLPGRPGPVVVRDHEVPPPRQAALEVRAEGLWAELTCEVPFEHWTYGLEAFGVRLDDAQDALHGEIGERVPVGHDLEWETTGTAPERGDDRYAQDGRVHGEVLIGRARVEVDATGRRAHGWGEQSQWPPPVERAAGDLGRGVLVPLGDGLVLERSVTGGAWHDALWRTGPGPVRR